MNKGWEVVRLRDVCTRVTTKSTGHEQRVLTVSAKYGLVEQETFFTKRVASGDLSTYWVVTPGDLVYNKSTSKDAPFGVVTRLLDDRPGLVTSLYIVFRADTSRVVPEFLELMCNSPRFFASLAGTLREGARSHGLLNVRLEEFFSASFALPTLAVQRRVVDLIGALDAHIKALDTEKGEVLMLRATLMSDHVASCDTRSSLATLVDVAQGKALPRGRQGVTSGPVPWFKIADMTGEGNHFGYNRADTSMTPEEIAALRGQILPTGSVVFPRVGAAVLTEKKRLLEVEGAVDENHLVLIPRPDTDSEYLLALMEWVQLSALVQSGAVPSLNMTLIRDLDVRVADPETQRELGHLLGRLRVLGRALDEEIGAARILRAITLASVLSREFEIPESYDALLAMAV